MGSTRAERLASKLPKGWMTLSQDVANENSDSKERGGAFVKLTHHS